MKTLMDAIEGGRLDVLETLLEEGADPRATDGRGNSLLQRTAAKIHAARMDEKWKEEELYKEMAAALVLFGADPGELGHEGEECDVCKQMTRYLLLAAVKRGDQAKVQEMAKGEEFWCEPEQPHTQTLMDAAAVKDRAKVLSMIEEGTLTFRYSQ